MGETRRRREGRAAGSLRGCIFRERMERLAVDFEKCTLPPDPISLSLSLFIPRVATCCDPVPPKATLER